MLGRWLAVFGLTLSCALGGPAAAQGKTDGSNVPRFVSLGSDKINVRAGPGKQYPVSWTFVRHGLPVMVVDEYGDWRRVMDSDGAVGWIHRALLSRRRTALVTGATRTLRRRPDASARPVLMAEADVAAKLLQCAPKWCELEIAGKSGWMRRRYIFGVLKNEVF